ncbi:hypothetical protein F4781DRAFT_437039 [Annulohypoxylon bovei var. microspora]|nr:hypothetical protein F4781DRAFT_437039 [Annulohypoxylon bovei var. microspora]
MPSVKNPNGPSKNRLMARAATARKANQKRVAGAPNKDNRVAKADLTRGARAGLLPTSGPNRALSSKKQRKLDRKIKHALKRKMEADGEVEMKDVSAEQTSKPAEEEMAIDSENIS